jgi:DNA-binding PadR family transcriptional regulator
MTGATASVIDAMTADPTRWWHGYDLLGTTGLKSGSLYPILVRLHDRGILDARWEADPPPGRPARHLYRLTGAGLQFKSELDAARATSLRPRLRGAQ